MSHQRALPLVVAPIAAVVVGVAAFGLALGSGMSELDAYERAVGVLAAAGLAAIAVVARPAWSLSLGLAMAVFSGHWGDMGFPVPLDRVLLTIGIVATIVREWRTTPENLKTRPIHWLLAVVALYAATSAVLSGTLHDSESRFALLDRFSLVAFVLFFVAPIAFRDARDRQILLGTLVALGGYLGLTALIETAGPRGLLLPRYIDDPTVGIHFDRARGPFTEAAANGLALYACAVAAAVAAVTWRDRRWRGLAGLIAALCLLGTLFTLTRAVWLAAAIASVLALLAARETRRFVLPAGVVGVCMVLVAFAAIPGLESRAQARENDKAPLWDRRNSNAAALRMIAERPIIGFGWGKFATDSLNYYRQSPDYPLTLVRDVHNVYLANAVELGLIGGGLWLLALALAVGGGVLRRGPPELRPWRIGLVAVAASYGVAAMTTPLAFTLPTLLLWTWAGIAWAGADPPRFSRAAWGR